MIEAPALMALARDVNFPPVRVGRCVVRGEAGWRSALAGIRPAIPRERVVLLRGLERPFLLSTPAGRQRLRNWIAARRASPTPPLSDGQRREWIYENLVAIGDESMLPAVVRGLCRLPAFVSDAVVRECAFFLNGGRLRGSYGGAAPADRAVVQIAGGPHVEATTLHECGHGFLGPLPTEDRPVASLVACARVMELARVEGWPALEEVEQRIAREERMVRALEQIWSARS